jgi:hypothetical protein
VNAPLIIGTRDETVDNCAPLFARLLGDVWRKLPSAVRQMHTLSSERLTEGRCTVERGFSIPSNWVASMFGFPKAADDLPVSVRFECENGTERWTRKFGEAEHLGFLRRLDSFPQSIYPSQTGDCSALSHCSRCAASSGLLKK